MTLYRLFSAVSWLLRLVSFAILVRAVLSWFAQGSRLYQWLSNVTEPFVRPFRRLSYWIINKTGLPVDLSTVFAMIGIEIVDGLWNKLYYLLRAIVR